MLYRFSLFCVLGPVLLGFLACGRLVGDLRGSGGGFVAPFLVLWIDPGAAMFVGAAEIGFVDKAAVLDISVVFLRDPSPMQRHKEGNMGIDVDGEGDDCDPSRQKAAQDKFDAAPDSGGEHQILLEGRCPIDSNGCKEYR